jgi:hypothetical protein
LVEKATLFTERFEGNTITLSWYEIGITGDMSIANTTDFSGVQVKMKTLILINLTVLSLEIQPHLFGKLGHETNHHR